MNPALLSAAVVAATVLLLALTPATNSDRANEIPDVRVAATDPGLHTNKGVLYHNRQAFSGWLIERHSNRAIKRVSMYLNGRRHGLDRTWYSTGKIRSERTFEHGKKMGLHLGWWENGTAKFAYEFEAGVHHGNAQEWHENGTLARHFRYKNGHEEGQQQLWWSNGKVRSNYVVRNGRRYGYLGMKPCIGNVSAPTDSLVSPEPS